MKINIDMNLFNLILNHITCGNHYDPIPIKSFINEHLRTFTKTSIIKTYRYIKHRATVSHLICVDTSVNGHRKLIKYDYWALKEKISNNPNRLLCLQEDNALIIKFFGLKV